jgi:3-deoxy-D-manno-octulosonic-acid transferase
VIRLIYSLVFILGLPMVLLHLYLKGRQYPQYRKRWKEHFGIFDSPNVERTIWVHAVSVGEALAAIPIIKRLQNERPDISIVVTTTTPTGADRIQSALGESVLHLYSPYDLPWVVKRFIRKIKPRLTVIMETELWPNFVHYSCKQNVPVVVVNARLSARSARNYARIPIPTNRLLLEHITEFACQGAGDAQRFIELGASPEKVKVTGSVKFDIQPPRQLDSKTRELFQPWLEEPFVWVAGSTHVGEDEIILHTHRLLLDAGVKAKLILVPRHPERFDSVAELIEQRGFAFARRSRLEHFESAHEVFLCDSMGEMMYCYNAGHVAFVGGSLIERGGHNPLEPASLSKPVLTGKHTFNFSDVFRNMVEAGAARVVDEQTLFDALMQLYQDAGLRKRMGKAALQVVETNRGSISRTLKILYRYLPADE